MLCVILVYLGRKIFLQINICFSSYFKHDKYKCGSNICLYCTYVDIQKFNTKYLVMYKVQMHTGAIS